MKSRYKVAYISRVIYPNPTAHALQTIQMAAALARQTGDACLFVRGLSAPKEQIRQQYAIGGAPLRICSLHANDLPSRLRRRFSYANNYNSAMAAILGLHPVWWRAPTLRNVLFVRGLRDFAYWGSAKLYLWWLRDWVSVYEAHDVAGLEPKAALEENPFELQSGSEGLRRQKQLRAMRNYDLILTVTQALADDLNRWSNGTLQPHVVRHASALPRLPRPPEIHLPVDRVVLGYVGTIDTYRGVDGLISAMRLLPDNYVLRLVGRIPGCSGGVQYPGWLEDKLREPEIGSKVEIRAPVPISAVMEEIDGCDIMLQPASGHILTLRYASPIKSFDYMVRGKPIVAADVPCHRELLQDGINARLYRLDDVEHLAASIMSLVEQPRQAEAIARAAWEQSADYSYDARARRILELIDEAWDRRQAGYRL